MVCSSLLLLYNAAVPALFLINTCTIQLCAGLGGFDLGLIEAQACPPAAAAGGAHGAGGAGAGVDTSAAVAAGVGTTCEIKVPMSRYYSTVLV